MSGAQLLLDVWAWRARPGWIKRVGSLWALTLQADLWETLHTHGAPRRHQLCPWLPFLFVCPVLCRPALLKA